MGCPHEMRPDMSVPDIAFCVLKNRGKALHFKELIAEVMAVKAINQANPGRLIAQWHTEINLDSRFIHHGSGEWGLREWQPKQAKVVKARPDSGSTSRSRGARDEEDEDALDFVDEEDEAEIEDDEDGYSRGRGRDNQYEDDEDER
jgi:DNA-directed RNA polymerase subunit delta